MCWNQKGLFDVRQALASTLNQAIDLARLCDQIAATADPRPDAERHAEAKRNRRLRQGNRPDGSAYLEWSHQTTAGVELLALLADDGSLRDLTQRLVDRRLPIPHFVI